jgi:23S rRNA (uridine2552-2'-O)-methyltransferase
VEALVGEKAVDLVLSDMAPNISGIDSADQTASLYLCELALEFAVKHLKSGGHFVVKVFQGEGFETYVKQVRASFATVSIRKPKASRPRSREVYLVAKSLKRV